MLYEQVRLLAILVFMLAACAAALYNTWYDSTRARDPVQPCKASRTRRGQGCGARSRPLFPRSAAHFIVHCRTTHRLDTTAVSLDLVYTAA